MTHLSRWVIPARALAESQSQRIRKISIMQLPSEKTTSIYLLRFDIIRNNQAADQCLWLGLAVLFHLIASKTLRMRPFAELVTGRRSPGPR